MAKCICSSSLDDAEMEMNERAQLVRSMTEQELLDLREYIRKPLPPKTSKVARADWLEKQERYTAYMDVIPHYPRTILEQVLDTLLDNEAERWSERGADF